MLCFSRFSHERVHLPSMSKDFGLVTHEEVQEELRHIDFYRDTPIRYLGEYLFRWFLSYFMERYPKRAI